MLASSLFEWFCIERFVEGGYEADRGKSAGGSEPRSASQTVHDIINFKCVLYWLYIIFISKYIAFLIYKLGLSL